MKKWIAAFLIVLVLVVAYIMLPEEIAVAQKVSIKVNANAAYRNMADQNNWNKWWPQERTNIPAQASFPLKQFSYHLQQKFFQAFLIQVNTGDQQLASTLSLIPLGIDYTIFDWKTVVQGNSWQKIQTFIEAKRLQDQMEEILQSFKDFIEKDANLYGFKVNMLKVKDTFLVTTKFTTAVYPQTNEIYQYISVLKTYVASQGAKETNYPMLHVNERDSTHYESMVAIPVSKELQGNGNIAFKRMVPGKILETEVHGGPATAREAMVQLGNYMEDHQLSAPAIPFMSLVTDRSKEKDTARWITKLYYPVY